MNHPAGVPLLGPDSAKAAMIAYERLWCGEPLEDSRVMSELRAVHEGRVVVVPRIHQADLHAALQAERHWEIGRTVPAYSQSAVVDALRALGIEVTS